VVTQGRIAALLELGAGFNPEFTGRENVFLNGEIMGLSRSAIERAFPSIAAFADIGDFINRPVKEYSSGMYVRLAFSTAIHVEPDILIVDEALAVGDAVFANRCVRKFEELKQRKVTVLFVSHDLGLVKQLSDRAMLLLLATTGLRNRELRELELADIHWRAGEVLVRHAKGHRDRVVPLLAETGVALSKYVLHGRPKTQERTVFLSHQPPVRAFGCSGAVSRIVLVRLQRGGLAIQRGGAHLLRHSLASQMVAQRRPIKEVADLLGHRNIDATAVYIKVAVPQLAEVALAFPGSAP